MEGKVIVILGPTCTGKTSLGIKLCQLFNGAIISADSRQVVRHMDIGTGKIPAGESNRQFEQREDRWNVDGVDIFGYDLVNPDEYFSAYDFTEYCRKVFPRVSRNGKNIFLVGGTGFYIDAVTDRASLEGIGPNMELRKSLEKLSTEELAEKLRQLDESIYKTIDTKNPARLLRAIEKVSQVKKSDNANKTVPIFEKATYIGLTAEREILYQRADGWVDSIFNERLFEEVKLIQTQFPKSHRLNGLIYKSAVDYLNGATDLDDAKQRAKFDMHAYIRRQQTWFKRNPEIRWFDIFQKNFDAGVTSIVESLVNGESELNG
ncbi:MAG: tRNA (adenosine(37)-N6)-dimethylallyltransferase MiaA [Patescibacteria group bacterium]